MLRAGLAALALPALAGCPPPRATVDPLALFQHVTALGSQYAVRTGLPYQLPESTERCVQSTCNAEDEGCKPSDQCGQSPLLKASDAATYYQLGEGPGGYAQYGKDSQFAHDTEALVAELDALMAGFARDGLLRELEARGLVPALMFDLDNTLEFSGPPDNDPTGHGPAIDALVAFVGRTCFRGGVDCYFITARPCSKESATSALTFLNAHVAQPAALVESRTFFSRNTEQLLCAGLPEGTQVAYKDVLRQALGEERHVFWLMSIGDQLTDSLGAHSGLKVRVPNQFFHSDVEPNQFAPWGAGICVSPTTIAPPVACAQTLVPHALAVTNASYCAGR